MPRRRRARGLELVDDVVDTAVDAIFDRAGQAWDNFRDRTKQPLAEDYQRQQFTCAACRGSFGIDDMEMVHPSNGFGTCRRCFKFLWEAGREKVATFAKTTARNVREGGSPPPPGGEPPNKVLGVDAHASVEEIKKAYRALAMQWHPDRLGPDASHEEKERSREQFKKIQRAYNVMIKIRQPPE